MDEAAAILMKIQDMSDAFHKKIDEQTGAIHRKIEDTNKTLRTEMKTHIDDLCTELQACQKDCKGRLSSLETNSKVKDALKGKEVEDQRGRKRFWTICGASVTAALVLAICAVVWKIFIGHIEIIVGPAALPPQKGSANESGIEKVPGTFRPGAPDNGSYTRRDAKPKGAADDRL